MRRKRAQLLVVDVILTSKVEGVESFQIELQRSGLWVRFCVQKDIILTKNSGICSSHFNAEFVKVRKRKTLRWVFDPVPTNYGDIDIPRSSVRPTPTTSRRHPNRTNLPNLLNEFRTKDAIFSFSDINDYKLKVQ